MGNPIPSKSRQQLAARDMGFCLRCAAASGHLHHRRSRRVRDEHTHCPCNLVSLCSGCHSQVHQQVANAMDAGMIVSQFESSPGVIPVRSARGLITLDCQGHIHYLSITGRNT